MLSDGCKPFLSDLQCGGDVGQEKPPEGVNIVGSWVGKALQWPERKLQLRFHFFVWVLSVSK